MASPCPASELLLSGALRGNCPFLHGLAQTHGEGFARSIAINPTCPASQRQPQPLLVELGDFARTLRLWHGEAGVVPLPHLFHRPSSAAAAAPPQQVVLAPPPAPAGPSAAAQAPLPAPAAATGASSARQGCRTAASTAATSSLRDHDELHDELRQQEAPAAQLPLHLRSALPLASMSMSFGGGAGWHNLHQFFKQHLQQNRRAPQQPQAQQQQHQQHSPASGGAPGLGHASAASAAGAAAAAAGQCPMRKVLGPFAGVVFNKQGHLACPEPIIKMRAALAATKPVKGLRPQALPVKFLAMGVVTALLNVPCGMWREHTEKFSTGWFIAVHATIPFIAMLRKAVIMPKYAILFTVATAIAGQAIGARLERRRMLEQPQAAAALGGGPKTRAVAAPRRLLLAKPAVMSLAVAPEHVRSERALPMASLLASATRWDERPEAGSSGDGASGSSSASGLGAGPARQLLRCVEPDAEPSARLQFRAGAGHAPRRARRVRIVPDAGGGSDRSLVVMQTGIRAC